MSLLGLIMHHTELIAVEFKILISNQDQTLIVFMPSKLVHKKVQKHLQFSKLKSIWKSF